MADENTFPKIHIDFIANGDYIHLRTDSGEEMAHVVGGFEENAKGIFEGIGNIKQASLVSGVFSGNAIDAGKSAPSAPAAPRAAANTAPGAIPECPSHGQMKDCRGQRTKNGEPFRNRYYCKKFGCKDSKPQGDWIE